MSSQLKETLKNLCCNNGWCYGVFWRVNRRNSMLLTLGDAYFEEQIGMVIDQMLQQVHMLGEGVIGQAAFTGKHQWMFSDTYGGDWCPTGSVDNQDVFQDNSHFPQQFSSGIKTIAVISVAPEGVVQLGSTHKILERMDFLDHIKSTFRQLGSIEGSLLGNALATSSELYNPSEAVPGVSCSNYWNIKTMHNNNFKELTGQSQPGMSLSHSSPFNVELQNESMTSMISNSSFQTNGQFQTSDADTQAISSLPNMHSQQVFSQLASSSANNSSARYPSMSTWSSEYSTLTSFEPHMASLVGRQESPNAFPADTHGLTCKNTFQNFQRDATYASYDTSGFLNTTTSGEFLEVNKPTGVGSGKLVDFQKSFQLVHPIEGELSKDSASFQSFLGENPLNNLSQWLIQPLEDCSRLVTPMDDNHSQTLGVTVASCSSGLAGDDVFNGVPVINANASAQISVSNIISSLNLLCDGKQNSSFPIQLPTDSDLFDSLGLTFDQNQGRECWDNILLPVGSGSNSNLSNGNSECVSELDVGSTSGPQKGFFAEFGLEQLLDSVAGTKPSSEDQLSAATARTGSTSVYENQIQFAGLSCCGPNMNGSLPESDPPKMTMHSNPKEALPKSQVGLWIDDTYSINTESAVTTQPMKSEEAAKAPKKRARPGESTRPRPKDRQQIQDRVKELRDIVPNGAKCSIDALLDRTIKHMLFLQNVTKYADKLKQADEPKMIGDENGVVLKDNSNGTGGGATWAFEIGGQTMVCPIIVEDLNPPGQMLVEMLCEERGFFLEIADIIRGFGLTILKGVMEVREDKIWARFAVEANRNVTRMDIFLSLVQLLQQTATTSGISSSNQPSKAAESSIPLFNNYQQNPLQLPISLADRLQ